jgi:hypothetical protein
VTNCLDCSHRKHVGPCPEHFPEENGPACGCHRPTVAEWEAIVLRLLAYSLGDDEKHRHTGDGCTWCEAHEMTRTRRDRVDAAICVTCSGRAEQFRSEKAEREYRISGMCQVCQDDVFGPGKATR